MITIQHLHNGHWVYNESALPRGVELLNAGCRTLEGESHAPASSTHGTMVLCALQGTLWVDLDSASHCLNAQDALAVALPEHVTLRQDSGAACALYATVFDRAGIVKALPAAVYRPFEAPGVAEALHALLLDAQYGTADAYTASQNAFGLLMACCRCFDAQAKPAYPPLVSSALSIIEEDYPYLFNIEELASRLEVSKYHLIREFTRAVGVSPGQYLAKTRMHHAKLLLKQREYGVEIVGQMVGYANGNYFCKVFRSHTGMSPGQYRNKYIVLQAKKEDN